MKILVIGLDCATPEILFQYERLTNLRRLMEAGCYGQLESIIPPITVPAWMCLATSQDPGSLGVYGFRNRSDHSYSGLQIANSKSIQELTIWDQMAREGKRSVIIGVPPSYPPRKVNGTCVGCFLTPDPSKDNYTYPEAARQEIAALVGDYPVDVKGFRTPQKDWLRQQVFEMGRRQYQVARHFLQSKEWDYFHFVDIGLDRVQHGFWEYFDPRHVKFQPGNPYETVIPDYYRFVDEQIGEMLELLDDETAVLVCSDHGAQRLDGGFCINEWLVQQGYLALKAYPDKVTPFSELEVDWERTRAWSEGGYYARIFINAQGREPTGVVAPAEYEALRNELKARLEALPDDQGRQMGTQVFKPEEIYKQVRNVAPDLIVHFGGLYWRSIGGVGYPGLHDQENDTGPDGCNHARFGSFILAAPGLALQGELSGAHLLNLAPTLLELAGCDIPASMQGAPLAAGQGERPALSADDETILRERLSGLGYIS
jgi:predicted AlkP superfamily phosphohydrolase/phosphomutase